jgi:hypothetical protein
MLLKMSSFSTLHKSSVSTGFTEQIMPILRILCSNGSLVTRTVIGLTTAKFKPLIRTITSQSHVTTDDQSASLSWNKAPIWGLRPDFHYCQTIAGLLYRLGADSIEKHVHCLAMDVYPIVEYSLPRDVLTGQLASNGCLSLVGWNVFT